MSNKKYVFGILLIGIVLILTGLGLFLFQDKKTTPQKQETVTDALNKVSLVEQYFIDQFPITDFNQIDNQKKLFFALTVINHKLGKSFSERRLEQVLIHYFGSTITWKHEDILDKDTKKVIYKYNRNERKYVLQATEYNLNSPYYFVSLATPTAKNTTLVVNQKYMFIDNRTSLYLFYAKLDDYLNQVNSIGSFDSALNNFDVTVVTSYTDLLVDYNYKFEKQNGSYILKSVQ